MLDVSEGDQLQHADNVDPVIDGNEHGGGGIIQDLTQRVHVVAAMRGLVIVDDELAADDQLDQCVDVVEGCGAERDVHVPRQ